MLPMSDNDGLKACHHHHPSLPTTSAMKTSDTHAHAPPCPPRAHVSWTVKQNGTKGTNEPSFTTVLGEQQLAFQREIMSLDPLESKLGKNILQPGLVEEYDYNMTLLITSGLRPCLH